ncbi:YolD-like family protein [Aquibacillus albus]|uniref:YolD-like family protein n=1 Tax=Aquibacillus albus TaxID=1168171 RepID=A0ABS2MVS4_9BACI|nr:YolD-like family protein [Aquibacillus albus]MBM7569888.1 hypothetical protein [Aquibacillus albus]
MVNDRGTIKWTSLMLPEHVEMLRQLWSEDQKTHKPVLDEHQLEEMNQRLNHAITSNAAITITYYRDDNYHICHGFIQSIDSKNRQLVIKNPESSQKVTVLLSEIINL